MNNQVNAEKKYFIGGISGVGKTTVLNKISKVDSNFEVISVSGCLMKWLGINKRNMGEFRELPEVIKDMEIIKMMAWLISHRKKDQKYLLFDSHYVIPTNSGLVEGTGEWISNMDCLFNFSAPIGDIIKRIKEDEIKTGRQRQIFKTNATYEQKTKTLSIYQQKNLESAKRISVRYKLPLYEIINKTGKLDLTVQNFMDIHNKIISNKSQQ